MKKVVFNSLLLIAGLLTIGQVKAQDNDSKFKKTKSYAKSYNLGGGDKVSLNNQFGEMKIVTWDKNEVKVEATITGRSNDESRAQQIIDRISITDGKDGSTVWFKTKFADENNKWSKGENKEHRNEGMEINYLVYMPAGNALKADNQFGKMIVPDFRGETELESQFGSLTAGKLTNAKSVTVQFGEANIQQINGGKLAIKFSQGTVNKLGGDVKSDLEFSNVKLMLDNDVKTLTINNSYSSVYLDCEKNFSANWDINTSHGDFSNKSDFSIKEEGNDDHGYGPKFNKTFKGVSGSGNAKVKVNSSFGEIVAGHNLQVDLSEKNKNKNKSKNKTTHI